MAGRAAQELAEEQRRRAEEQARTARRMGLLSIGLLAMVVVAVVFAMFAWNQTRIAEQQTGIAEQQSRLARVRQLPPQVFILYVQLDKALLLSLEANHIHDIIERKGNLLYGLQRSPHLTTFLTSHTKPVTSVVFSPDDTTLVSGSVDKTIRSWDVNFASWRDRARRIANRNLTRPEWQQYIGEGLEPYHATCPGLPFEEKAAPEVQAKMN